MSEPVYLDHHATTPLDRRVLEAMLPFLQREFGNAASRAHPWGRRAARAVVEARESVAALLNVHPDEVLFTAGATESNNIALLGAARAAARHGRGRHLVTTGIEHHSVIRTLEALAREGFALTVVPPDGEGLVAVDAIAAALRPDTVLVSVIAAQGEIGTLQPVAEIGALCRGRGIRFHSDATQWIGKLPFDVDATACDLAALSAHKFYGPKGVGALVVRRGVEVAPTQFGGGQEGGLRSGTVNVPGVVGLGMTARIAAAEMDDAATRERELRDRFLDAVCRRVSGVHLNGSATRRLPGNLNLSFEGIDGGALLAALDGFALSTGSACVSDRTEPSEILLAVGRDPELARGSVRIGLGRSTAWEDLARLLDRLEADVPRLRGGAPNGRSDGV